MPEIVVTFDTGGGVNIEGVGFKGKSCTDATKFLEKALGTVAATSKKAEYYESAGQVEQHIKNTTD